MFARLSALSLLIVLAGCVSTGATSVVDRQALSGERFGSLVVVANMPDLPSAKAAEEAAAEELAPLQVQRGLLVAGPSARQSPEAFAAAIRSSGADGAFLIEVQSEGETGGGYIYMPMGTIGAMVPAGPKPAGTYDAYIIDFRSGKIVWQAQIDAAGARSVDFEDLAASAAREAVRQAKADGVL